MPRTKQRARRSRNMAPRNERPTRSASSSTRRARQPDVPAVSVNPDMGVPLPTDVVAVQRESSPSLDSTTSPHPAAQNENPVVAETGNGEIEPRSDL